MSFKVIDSSLRATIPFFRLSYKAFLPPFRMTIGGKSAIMRETLSVILNECEGSVTGMRGNGKMLSGA